jgi:outer membrane protein assembly factor BamB
VAYVGAGDLFTLDATTGSLIWQGSYSSHDGGPAVANGVIYESEDGEFMAAVDAATGNLIGFSSQSCVANGTPAIANGLSL